jgi:type II secretory pathway pseudopilin PulG
MRFQISNFKFQLSAARAAAEMFPRAKKFAAFSLVEVLLVITLLSLIILALMNVFSSTQQAFRAAVTQTDVLEGGRNAMQMMADDLRANTPAFYPSNVVGRAINDTVNFFTLGNKTTYTPLVQTLPASPGLRTNVLNYFFVLGREHNKWTGTGYIVDNASATELYPLYRFYAETNLTAWPASLFYAFNAAITARQWTNMSHLLNGVVHLAVRPRDPQGHWINNNFVNYSNAANTFFLAPAYGETQVYMFSNAIPAAVELEMAILEDRTLQRANAIPNATAQVNYLQKQSGHVHLFRQLVTVPNADPSAYQ